MEFSKLLNIIENNFVDTNTDIWQNNSYNDKTHAFSAGGTKGNTERTSQSFNPRQLYPHTSKFPSFVSWYHYNRGDWNDVLSLAKQDQEVKSVIDRMIQQYERSEDPTASGDNLYAKFSGELESLIEKKKAEQGMGPHKYRDHGKSQDNRDDIIGSDETGIHQNDGSDLSQRLSSLEKRYADLFNQFDDLRKKLAV